MGDYWMPTGFTCFLSRPVFLIIIYPIEQVEQMVNVNIPGEGGNIHWWK